MDAQSLPSEQKGELSWCLLADESSSWASGLAADAIMPSVSGRPRQKKVEFC
jgi:hypothetical protein